jgi:hypothetical protein
MMFTQQAIMKALTESFSTPSSYGSVLDFLDLRNQDKNRSLAYKGSLDGSLATLDLSDASDRLSNQLVRSLFDRYPVVLNALDATRSRKADVQGKTIRLSKYASMGSALCFPIESMVFLAIAITSCLEKNRKRGYSHLPISARDVRNLIGSVSVYGDDIIVPSSAALITTSLLERFAFKVNDRKSFVTGKFRESCGADWYGGVDISISRLRRPIPVVSSDVEAIVSLVALRNDLFQKRGLWKTAEYLDGIIEKKIRYYPSVDCNSSQVVGAHTFSDPDYGPDVHWDTQLHRYVIKGMSVRADQPVNSVDGWNALLKYFHERALEPDVFGFETPLDVEAYHRSGRPTSVRLNAGWSTPK